MFTNAEADKVVMTLAHIKTVISRRLFIITTKYMQYRIANDESMSPKILLDT